MPAPAQGEELDVNTDAGFNASLARSAGLEPTTEQIQAITTTETDVAGGLDQGREVEEAPQERPRDPQTGRFLPQGTPPEAPTEGAPPTTQEAEQTAAPAVDWEQRYRELEKAYGRQGQEMGERLARLEGRAEAAPQQQEAPIPQVTAGDIERLEADYEEMGGPMMMSRVAFNAPHLMEEALDIWHDDDPRGARRYERQLDAIQQEAERAGQQQAPAQQPAPQQVSQEAMGQTVQAAIANIPEAERRIIAPHMQAAMDQAPARDKRDLASPDAQERFDALATVIQRARLMANEAAAQNATQQQRQEAAAAKQAAQVATGSLRSVEGGTSAGGEVDLDSLTPEERSKEVSKRLYEQMMKTETTSVMDGLRQGKSEA